MSNPFGVNQLGSDRVPYGQAKKMKQLADSAPMSGAPIATPAINAPQRARRPAPKAKPRVTQQGPIPAHPVAGYQQLPQIPQTQLYSEIASQPGASPLVQQIFGQQ